MLTAIQRNIKKQLDAKNMTAAELERRTGIPHAVVNILHGRSKNPSIRTTQAIAKELGCSVEELINENEADPATITTNAKINWQPELYIQVTEAVCAYIQKLGLQPETNLVSSCVTEAYNYCVESPDQKVDQRFIGWLVNNKTAK